MINDAKRSQLRDRTLMDFEHLENGHRLCNSIAKFIHQMFISIVFVTH